MKRHHIMLMLIGAIAALAGFATTTFLAQRGCPKSGGVWDAAERRCLLSSGEATGAAAFDVVTGVIVALVSGLMLYRVLLYVTGRARQRS